MENFYRFSFSIKTQRERAVERNGGHNRLFASENDTLLIYAPGNGKLETGNGKLRLNVALAATSVRHVATTQTKQLMN